MSTRVHRVRSIWSAPFQRAGQSRPSPTLSAKARRKAVSLCVKSRWSCPAGKNMKNRKKRRALNSIDVIHDASYYAVAKHFATPPQLLSWWLHGSLLLDFTVPCHSLRDTTICTPQNFSRRCHAIPWSTWGGWSIVQLVRMRLHWCNLVQSFTAKVNVSTCPNSEQVVGEELAMSASTHGGNTHRRKCTAQSTL